MGVEGVLSLEKTGTYKLILAGMMLPGKEDAGEQTKKENIHRLVFSSLLLAYFITAHISWGKYSRKGRCDSRYGLESTRTAVVDSLSIFHRLGTLYIIRIHLTIYLYFD